MNVLRRIATKCLALLRTYKPGEKPPRATGTMVLPHVEFDPIEEMERLPGG